MEIIQANSRDISTDNLKALLQVEWLLKAIYLLGEILCPFKILLKILKGFKIIL